MQISNNHPFLRISNNLAELCRPLEILDINHFTYQKHFFDGSRINLSNKPEWIEDYYRLRLFESSLYEKHPNDYDEGFQVFIGDYPFDVYQHGKQYYNSAHSLIITQQQDHGCEFYIFATKPQNEKAIHYLSNNLDVLYHFILYIKDKGLKLFAKANKSRLIIPFNQKDNFKIKRAKKKQDKNKVKKDFYLLTHVHKYQFENGQYRGIKLSNREIDCIAYLFDNKTAEETAEIMNISRRTVESYFENIKLKLDCNDKLDIVKCLKDNHYINALRNSEDK